MFFGKHEPSRANAKPRSVKLLNMNLAAHKQIRAEREEQRVQKVKEQRVEVVAVALEALGARTAGGPAVDALERCHVRKHTDGRVLKRLGERGAP